MRHGRVRRSHPLYNDVMALNQAIAALRHALGKRTPEDLCYGSPEWEAANADFARDVLRVLGDEADHKADG